MSPSILTGKPSRALEWVELFPLRLLDHRMPEREAAEMLEISVEALESLLARGRRALKQKLADGWVVINPSL